MIQFAIVVRERTTPFDASSFSCRYNGIERKYLSWMMCASSSGEQKLCGMNASGALALRMFCDSMSERFESLDSSATRVHFTTWAMTADEHLRERIKLVAYFFFPMTTIEATCCRSYPRPRERPPPPEDLSARRVSV